MKPLIVTLVEDFAVAAQETVDRIESFRRKLKAVSNPKEFSQMTAEKECSPNFIYQNFKKRSTALRELPAEDVGYLAAPLLREQQKKLKDFDGPLSALAVAASEWEKVFPKNADHVSILKNYHASQSLRDSFALADTCLRNARASLIDDILFKYPSFWADMKKVKDPGNRPAEGWELSRMMSRTPSRSVSLPENP